MLMIMNNKFNYTCSYKHVILLSTFTYILINVLHNKIKLINIG